MGMFTHTHTKHHHGQCCCWQCSNHLLRYRCWCMRRKAPSMSGWSNDDADVTQEHRRIAEMSTEEKRFVDLVTLDNLSKAYFKPCRRRSRFTVDRLYLGIPRGECFGLLGVNGAGKTTTFKLLTAELLPTFGTAFVAGHSVVDEPRKVYGMKRFILVIIAWRQSRGSSVQRIHVAQVNWACMFICIGLNIICV